MSLGGSLVSGVGGMMAAGQAQKGMQAFQDAQNQANAEWVAYQNQIRRDATIQEQQFREKADLARNTTLQQIAPANQKLQQQDEQDRLNTVYQNPQGKNLTTTGQIPANYAVPGQDTSGKDTPFTQALGTAVSAASNMARQRIAALATTNSYGGSFGGLGHVVPQELQQGGNAINLQNAERAGNLATYQREAAVQPLNYAMGPGVESDMSMAKTLGGLAGSLFSKGITGGMSSGMFGGGGAGGGNVSVPNSVSSSDWMSGGLPAWS
jgi:hypothetical protein